MARPPFRLVLAVALVLSGLYAAVILVAGLERGLTRTVSIDPAAGSGTNPVPRRTIEYIGSESLDKERRDAGLPAVHAYEWNGIWDVPASGVYDLYTSADNTVTIVLDGRVAVQHGGGQTEDRAVTKLPLEKGPHQLNVTYIQGAGDHLKLSWGADGSGPRPFGQADLYPSLRAVRAYHRLVPLKWAAFTAWLLALAIALAHGARDGFKAVGVRLTPDVAVVSALAAGVLLYAGLLRFDALIGRWGVLPGPVGVEAAQRRLAMVVSHIRPAGLAWSRSPFTAGGDPYAYLQQARERTRFYAAHLREPVFVFSVKAALDLTGQADQAASATSAVFSWLTVLATGLLGAYAFSPWVGLGAALALSVERDVIGMGVAGYRDDAFGFFVVMVAWASLWVHDRPTYRRAAIWGVIAGAACLTRLTAMTFVLPALGYVILWRPSGTRLRTAVAGLVVFLVVVSPFLISSWMAFGNPFFAVTGLWSTLTQGGSQLPATSSRYLVERFARRPVGYLDMLYLAALYSFENKWQGFDAWSALPIAGFLSICAAIGLLTFCWSPRGRMLLLVLVASLAPFLTIWDMPNGNEYRYTMHAYPFFLIAACVAVEGAFAWTAAVPSWRTFQWSACRSVAIKAAVTLIAVAWGWLAVAAALPYARMLEELRQDRQTVVAAGPRDRLFFRRGWHAPVTVGNVTARFSMDREATVWLPMAADRDARLTIRLDPFVFEGAPTQQVRLTLNGTPLPTLTLHANPNRFGSYSLEVPRRIVRGGLNRLDLAASYSTLVGSVPQPAVRTVERPATFAETQRALDVSRSVPTANSRLPVSFEATLDADERVGFRIWYVLVALSVDRRSP